MRHPRPTKPPRMVRNMAKQQRYFVDLFAGCGGLSLGLEQAGWTPAFVNELNADAMETYLMNRDREFPHLRDEGFHLHDIKELVANDGARLRDLSGGLKRKFKFDCRRGELDLVVGGPPCQGFSGIGHRRSYSVHKKQLPSNFLFQDMAYVVSQLKPKMFLFENVRGLLYSKWTSSGTNGEIWEAIREHFNEIGGYQIAWKLVYAKQFGVPQNRPRVLMVGVRQDLEVPALKNFEDAVEAGLLPNCKMSPPDLIDLLGDLEKHPFENGAAIAEYPRKPKTKVQFELRRGAGRELTEHEYSKHSAHVLRKFKAMHDSGGDIPESMRTKKFAQRLLLPRWDDRGPTITATSLSDDYVHYSQPRALTVREWARLQMFPDRYQFAGKRTTGGIRRAGNPLKGIFDRELPKYTQIGNAVPVKLAKELGKHFAKLLSSASA